MMRVVESEALKTGEALETGGELEIDERQRLVGS